MPAEVEEMRHPATGYWHLNKWEQYTTHEDFRIKGWENRELSELHNWEVDVIGGMLLDDAEVWYMRAHRHGYAREGFNNCDPEWSATRV